MTVTTFCDINLLFGAQRIATNYIGGPVSIAVFIDADYTTHSDDVSIKRVIDEHFGSMDPPYDIAVGLLYYNESHPFYQSKGFQLDTPLPFRFPMNPLRNLAEYQVVTEWTFSIDVDFWYLAHSLNHDIHRNLDLMDNIVAEHGENVVFIVPAFEVMTSNKVEYSSLSKPELMQFIESDDISPFHFDPRTFSLNTNPQRCTDYLKWYSSSSIYEIDPQDADCSLYFEPWYIMKSAVSRKGEYRWDNRFIGRGYSKVQRFNTLRHHCFKMFVLNDLFIIHAAEQIHVEFEHTLRNQWTGKNWEMLIKQRRIQYRERKSCLSAPLGVRGMRLLKAMFLGLGQPIFEKTIRWVTE